MLHDLLTVAACTGFLIPLWGVRRIITRPDRGWHRVAAEDARRQAIAAFGYGLFAGFAVGWWALAIGYGVVAVLYAHSARRQAREATRCPSS